MTILIKDDISIPAATWSLKRNFTTAKTFFQNRPYDYTTYKPTHKQLQSLQLSPPFNMEKNPKLISTNSAAFDNKKTISITIAHPSTQIDVRCP